MDERGIDDALIEGNAVIGDNLAEGLDEKFAALNIPVGQWHTVMALESGTVILEVKDGKYEPIGPEDILG